MCPSLSIAIASTTYGRNYESFVELEWDDLRFAETSWLIYIIKTFFEQTPISKNSLHTFVYSLRNALRIISNEKELLEIANVALPDLDFNSIARLFGLLESRLKLSEFTGYVKYYTSRDFRRVCIDGLKMAAPERVRSRRSIKFKTSLTLPRTPSTLLSDSVFEEEGHPLDPLGALPHDSYQDLYLKTKAQISSDLERLMSCCSKDLIFFSEVREKLEQISKIDVPVKLVEMIREYIVINDLNDSKIRRRAAYSDEEIVAAYLIVQHEYGSETLNISRPLYYCKMESMMQRLFGDYAKYFKRPKVFFELPFRCIGVELHALLLLLLCHTGWNVGGVLRMERKLVEKDKGFWKVQGFKDKTDDYTPPEYFDFSIKDIHVALTTLVWHHSALISQGLIGSSEQQLWFCGGAMKCYKKQGVGMIPVRPFYERHGLPKFSYSDIRNQVFEKNRLDGRNIESIRRKAGHRNRNTTVGYLDSVVSRRIFSSMNLEFSRRLENTVVYNLSSLGLVHGAEYDADMVRTDLFLPIGDGAYCADHNNPPNDSIVFDGVCAGLTCHCEGGCENRKIIIDECSLIDLVRKKKYYLSNWVRLESNNPAAFRKYHFDSMAYVLSLYDYVKNSRYRVFLEQIEKRLHDEGV